MATRETSGAGRPAAGIPAAYAQVLTHAAFVVAAAAVLGRLTVSEAARDALPVVPGQNAPPLSAGATAGLVLDLLWCVPALLVLARRLIDPTYALRMTWAMLPLFALAAWVAASVAWADDPFLALVNAAHWVAATALSWAAAQLVRTWKRLRLVAGVAVAAVLVLTAKNVVFRTVDLPDMQANFEETKGQLFADRGWSPDSPQARQFAGRIERGTMQGFSTSPNTNGALLVLGALVALAAAAQRRRDGDAWGFPLALAAGVPAALAMAWFTQSKAALGGFVLGAAALAAWPHVGPALARRPKAAFAGLVGLFLLGALATAAYGTATGTLPIDSLRFRWAYWTGAAGVLADAPLMGVGWASFGDAYLVHRPAGAPEEVMDPHNAFARFAAETGVVGLILAGVLFARLAWEIVRPAKIPAAAGTAGELYAAIGVVPALATLVGVLAAVDLSFATEALAGYAQLQIIERVLYGGLMVLGVALVATLAPEEPRADGRVGPLLAAGVAVALGIFFLQSMLDVMLFEPAATGLVALLAGALVGARTPSVAGRPLRTPLVVAASATAAIGLILAVIFVVVPVALAESARIEADAALRRGEAATALASYRRAATASPVGNAEYARRAAEAATYAGRPAAEVRALWDDAVATQPGDAGLRLRRARFESALPGDARDIDRLLADYEAAVELNPADPPLRVEYADILRGYGFADSARAQYAAALAANAAYDPNEIERLPAAEVARLERLAAGG